MKYWYQQYVVERVFNMVVNVCIFFALADVGMEGWHSMNAMTISFGQETFGVGRYIRLIYAVLVCVYLLSHFIKEQGSLLKLLTPITNVFISWALIGIVGGLSESVWHKLLPISSLLIICCLWQQVIKLHDEELAQKLITSYRSTEEKTYFQLVREKREYTLSKDKGSLTEQENLVPRKIELAFKVKYFPSFLPFLVERTLSKEKEVPFLWLGIFYLVLGVSFCVAQVVNVFELSIFNILLHASLGIFYCLTLCEHNLYLYKRSKK
ncbi:hypothetical protein [Enterococcus sp. DIV0682]|uniref:hypothetical protein n=1 Tax=Enterococcus sp. DIV0682 TaxID=2774899 RepID=UPI0019E26F3F|nr:hypothetical protein [Enterococcus faecalis]EHZ0460654.1 hypothetical protein [Enterococcus faecalis]